ncbi:hypothetical protein DEU47_11315 [Bacillus sp. AG236]|nr:hypothetical protein DEU47_11315 [Bacillus sp. AG236]
MSEKQLPSLNKLLQSRMEVNLDTTRSNLESTMNKYNAVKINLNLPKYENIIPNNFSNLAEKLMDMQKQQTNLLNWAESVSNSLVTQGIIRNQEALKETLKQSFSFAVPIPNNLSLATRLQMKDAAITMRKGFESIPNYGEIFKKTIELPFGDLYKNIFDEFDAEAFIKAFPRSDKEDIDEGLNVFDGYEEIEEENVKVVNPRLYNISMHLVTYVNVSDMHITNNIANPTAQEDETKTFWEKYGKPTLLKIGAVFMIWATSTDPVSDMAIVKSLTKIAHTIEHYAQEHCQELKIEIKEPAQEGLNKYDSIDTDNTIG